MSKTKKPTWNHPFGVQVERFQIQGIHPGLCRQLVINDRTPCDYNPQSTKCIRKPNGTKQPWQVAHESQEFSENFGYQNADLLAYRRFMLKQLGPGSHDINIDLFKQAQVSPCLNQNLGKQKRFHKRRDVTPGPASYNLKPYCCKVPHIGPTIGCSKRFKDVDKPWFIPCNRYSVKDFNSIDAKINKLISIRGPYDCFTGPRIPQNMFNHFSPGKPCTPDKYYLWPSNLDVFLRHPLNKQKGKFGKAERFPVHPVSRHMLSNISTCYRDPSWPSPCEYVIADGIQPVKKNQKYSLGTSGLEVRPGEKWKISPGPGRYDTKLVKCFSRCKRNPTSVFISKTKRTEYKTPVYNAF